MKKILAIFFVIFLVSCSENSDKVLLDNGNAQVEIKVEIADDNDERAKGLMFRESLEENEGMLFVFDNSETQHFWMKNTLIPLDIIFIDDKFEIVSIRYAVPCKQDPCEVYSSSKPVKYVLEVNGNFTKGNEINVGDKIKIK